MASRRGIGEVVGSVSMLAVTIALLAGASVVGVLSVRKASALIQSSSEAEQRDAGVLVSVLMTRANSSGTFIWLYDYGWTSEPVKAVYVQGQSVDWSSSCPGDWSGSLCLVSIASQEKGELTIVIGGFSIAASV
jgi:hypothetical protein